jgi:hypothetical protein
MHSDRLVHPLEAAFGHVYSLFLHASTGEQVCVLRERHACRYRYLLQYRFGSYNVTERQNRLLLLSLASSGA